MKKLVGTIAVALVFYGVPAMAATKTVTLAVKGMTCAACPITVKKALD
ncbi:MAG TPA: mercuric transport protein periplasmic component, partial [Terriglobia bacterium]|nr:mercuric transport protein periplasmic component [Terriglobia bacterium]